MKSDNRATLTVFGVVFGTALLIGGAVLLSGYSDAPLNRDAARNDESLAKVIHNSDLQVGDYVYLKTEGTFHRVTGISTDANTETKTYYVLSGWPSNIWDRIQLRVMTKDERRKYPVVE